MNPERVIRVVVVIALVLSFSHSLEARSHNLQRKAHVHFLATSIVIRTTWGMNEDVYLAELHLSSKEESALVRLIDEYPNSFPSLSTEALTSAADTILRVRRDSQCDLPYGAMLLRTAPGDPMAIVHERLGYQPKMDKRPEPSAILPCYRTVRR